MLKKWIQKLALNFVINQNWKWHNSNGREGIQLSFENRFIPRVKFWRADMEACEFNYAKLTNSTFWSATMNKCDMSHAEMNFAKFEQTNLFRCELGHANLRQARHQIHIRNRQKEDLIRVFDALDRMDEKDEFKFAVKQLFRLCDVQRPRLS